MRKLILTLLLLTITTSNTSANWEHLDNFNWKYTCSWEDYKGIVILLDGLSTIPNTVSDTTTGFLESLNSNCYLLVSPDRNTYELNGVPYLMYDITDTRSIGQDTADLAKLIIRAHEFGGTTTIIGGSNGAVMGYKVANVLRKLGKDGVISNLVLLDGVSPYGVSDTLEKALPFKNIEAIRTVSLLGFTYWEPVNREYSYILLGMSSDLERWNIRTLIEYSVNDTTLPEDAKVGFAYTLSWIADDLTIRQFGEGHDVGAEGLEYVLSWLE